MPKFTWMEKPEKNVCCFAQIRWKNYQKCCSRNTQILVTVSGLLIDGNQQVLGQDYEPIPGLCATGNCMTACPAGVVERRWYHD